ncbi:MAG: V-type ATP synthase subunit I [Spirochaetaceae bacterium]|jgi:V/A-type H+-transporting ATPase subunit I|nr:V-type ATP synthase subunit I [Spirochaetaceae bacterium]
MIVPMKKVSLVVMDKYREESLDRLRDMGILHLERKNISSETLSKLLDRKAKTDTALGILKPYEAEAKKARGSLRQTADVADAGYAAAPKTRAGEDAKADEPFSSDAVNRAETPDTVTGLMRLSEEKKALYDRLSVLSKEQGRVEGWGNFNPGDIRYLAEKGIVFYLYEFTPKAFAELPEGVRYIAAGGDKAVIRVLVLDDEIPDAAPFALPESSLSEINSAMADIHDRLADIERQFAALSVHTGAVEAEREELLSRIEFETARAGMDTLAELPSESSVAWITGFVPHDELGLLKRAAAENGWALSAGDPGPDDDVPTKLKNNPLASLINPLTDFLEVVPGYNEVDISGWFLLFFIIFFGMIFGDAGYGSIILIAAVAGIIKTAKKGVPPAIKLLLLLGLSNFTWGMLTCSWFGIEDMSLLPALLKNLSLPLISNVSASQSAQGKAMVQQNLMIFCFSLALLQLSIGHILAILKTRTLKILGDIGSMSMLAGMYFIVLSLIASNEYRRIPLSMPAVYVFAAGFLLNLVFANYDGSIGRSILESLKNFISVILGIANVFSDIMSYIRLWAVGLAGAAIASTVNSMAGPMLGHLIFFVFGIILLVFGHGLNIVLNVLSVLVHGVRLNTLEFSGHAGLTWAGHAYKPFSRRMKKTPDL